MKVFEWFQKNCLNLTLVNVILSQLLCLKEKFKLERLFWQAKIELNYQVYIFYGRLNFGYRFTLFNFVSKKLHDLTRICKYMDQRKRRRTLIKAFVTSHFSHCLLTWMFHNRNMERHIHKIHKRALKLFYNDTLNLSFEDLLTKDKSVRMHQRHVYPLAIEICS